MNALVWFRTDLRLTDNEAVTAAILATGGSAFVYVYDDSGEVGKFRKKYLVESLRDLRDQLRARGADLICIKGDPVQVLPQICAGLQTTDIYYSKLSAFNEVQTEAAVDRALETQSVRVHKFQTQTLLCEDDVKDFDLHKPMGFSKLRGFIEKSWPIRAPLSRVDFKGERANLDLSAWDLDSESTPDAALQGFSTEGGETAALARLQHYFWKSDRLRSYKETRNGLIEQDDSSKFSPSLAMGCLSARTIYQAVRRYEAERAQNSSTLWFLYELIWRDHFHFLARARGHRLFTTSTGGVANSEKFETWRLGETAQPFVNAALNELRTTGWMSNRMRQNAASYLIHDLGVDWRMGARWFERCLVDYDPCSNWGNWAYIAGAGFDGKPHVFNVEQQASAYDADARYTQLWTRA